VPLGHTTTCRRTLNSMPSTLVSSVILAGSFSKTKQPASSRYASCPTICASPPWRPPVKRRGCELVTCTPDDPQLLANAKQPITAQVVCMPFGLFKVLHLAVGNLGTPQFYFGVSSTSTPNASLEFPAGVNTSRFLTNTLPTAVDAIGSITVVPRSAAVAFLCVSFRGELAGVEGRPELSSVRISDVEYWLSGRGSASTVISPVGPTAPRPRLPRHHLPV
jgi:hypothetical protein